MVENKFVAAFTPAEVEAVKKLKEALPDIVKNALPSTTEEAAAIPDLWNVKLDKDSKDERLDVILVKFLRARNLQMDAATKMLTDTLAWRREFKIDALMNETFDESIFSSVGYLHKSDKNGRPVCYNFYGDLDQNKVFGDVQRFIRWRVKLMEEGVELIDFVNIDSMVQVHDYKGASMFGRTANAKAATQEIIKIMQDNYPEFLAVKFFVNVPWWGSKIFKLLRPVLPEATFKKFVVCSNDELTTTLTQYIAEENLPTVYQTGKSRAVQSTGQTEEKKTPKTSMILKEATAFSREPTATTDADVAAAVKEEPTKTTTTEATQTPTATADAPIVEPVQAPSTTADAPVAEPVQAPSAATADTPVTESAQATPSKATVSTVDDDDDDLKIDQVEPANDKADSKTSA